MNASEKFQLEFVTTDELCHLAKKAKSEIETLRRDMKLFGKEDDSYPQWKNQLWQLQRRYNYIIRRIKDRQMKMF